MVLVHGSACSGATFDALRRCVPSDLRVHAVDLPGHGPTPAGPGPWTLDSAARFLDAWWQALGGTDAVLVGHSMGGAISTLLALGKYRWVRGLVVIDPAYGAADEEMTLAPRTSRRPVPRQLSEAHALVAGAFSPDAPTQLVERAARDVLATDARVPAAWYRSQYLEEGAWAGHDAALRVLARRTVPTLALYPTRERARTEEEAADLAQLSRAPGVQVRIAPVRSHFLHEEAPAWSARELVSWLDGALGS